MKSLNTYINEGLADWGEDDKLNKKISKQTSKAAIKQEIIDWITNNTTTGVVKNRFTFDFDTMPIIVDYGAKIKFNENTDSLTNGIFQWGKVSDGFNCSGTNITTLEGAPKEIGMSFDCSNCDSLKSLEGAPKKVGEFFSCNNCKSLKSLEDAPKEVGKEFYCLNCGTQFTEKDVKKVCMVKGKIYC